MATGNSKWRSENIEEAMLPLQRFKNNKNQEKYYPTGHPVTAKVSLQYQLKRRGAECMGRVFKVFLASGNLTSRIYKSQNFSLEFSRWQLLSTSDTCFLKCYGSSGRSQGSGQVLRSSRRKQPGSHRIFQLSRACRFPRLGTGLPQKALSVVAARVCSSCDNEGASYLIWTAA